MYLKNIADRSNYGAKRQHETIEGIVLHYVGSGKRGETVKNNLAYFHNNKNLGASAHLFVDDKDYGKSVPLNYDAYAVGKDYRSGRPGEAVFYGILNNHNTVSIEICDYYSDKDLTPGKIKNLKKAIKHVYKYCPNIKYICRHYDINGKECPASAIDLKSWEYLLSHIIGG